MTASKTTDGNQSDGNKKPETSSNDVSIAELQSVLEPWEEEEDGTNEKSSQSTSQRLCPGHQVAIATEATIQELDIKEESEYCVKLIKCMI